LPAKADSLKWHSWRAYRRGLATNLHELGIPDKVIQAILRHEDVKTTQKSYIKTVPSLLHWQFSLPVASALQSFQLGDT
jgi:integrase